MKTTFVFFLFSLFLIQLPLSAQDQTPQLSTEGTLLIPSKISYQGVLTDNAGVPQNGTFTMAFGLYTTPTGGSALWSETQNTVQVTNGIFNVLLGSSTPINLPFDVTYYLGVSVQGTDLLPRIELASSAYSFNSTRPWTQSGSNIYYNSGAVLIGTTSGGNIKLRIATGTDNQGVNIINNSSGQLALRINNSAGAARALFIENASADGAVLITNSSNATNAVSIDNTGTGNALRVTNSNGSRGLYVVNSGGGEAARFAGTSANVVIEGNLDVGGTLSKGGGTFMIDHPLDPENMILRHSFVESPDMMNIYNGNVTTDPEGLAEIQLPHYFDALNKDFRYQLTVIGQFAQAIVIKEIENNRFTIRTDKQNVKVSWQVTGIRKDKWAEKNRIVVEERKSPDSQGFYIHPEAYGQPHTLSTEWAKRPMLMKLNEAAAHKEPEKE